MSRQKHEARFVSRFVAFALALAGVANAAEVRPVPKYAPEGIIFKSALELEQQPMGIQPELRNGEVAVSREWPASLYVTFTSGTATYSCTAALVGPRVMTTAAHCVPESGKVNFELAGKKFVAACDRHLRYLQDEDASADYAICSLDQKLQPPAGFLFEKLAPVVVSLESSFANTEIVLTGFGCTTDTGGGTDGKYRVGINTIGGTSQSHDKLFGAGVYEPHERNNLFTKDEGANLCPGDSGGPAFRRVPGARPGKYANRIMVGINSRVFCAGTDQKKYGSSLISATVTRDFMDWAKAWAKTRNLDACGLHGALNNCR